MRDLNEIVEVALNQAISRYTIGDHNLDHVILLALDDVMDALREPVEEKVRGTYEGFRGVFGG